MNQTLAEYYSLAARYCELEGLHKKAIEYTSEAITLYQEMGQQGTDISNDIGWLYKQIGESYMALGLFDEAKASFNNAIDAFSMATDIIDNIRKDMIRSCEAYLDTLQ